MGFFNLKKSKELEAEVVKKVGIKREAGYMYMIDDDGNVRRVNPKAKGRAVQEVIAKGVKREKGYLYFLDQDGNIARKKFP